MDRGGEEVESGEEYLVGVGAEPAPAPPHNVRVAGNERFEDDDDCVGWLFCFFPNEKTGRKRPFYAKVPSLSITPSSRFISLARILILTNII
jgi:hypothetical protein